MANYSPTQRADKINTLRLDEPLVCVDDIGGPLTPEHARKLLRVARGLTEWYKIMAVLNIGDFCFDDEFVDYAIDMLTYAPVGVDPMPLLQQGQDPFAVGLHATNLLIARKTISQSQYDRIARLPDNTPGKQTLLDTLRARIK
jgi:hypothetical protein